MSSVELWTYAMVILSFGLYIYIGYANRVRDTKGFYVAGQGVPAIANGAATAADWMSAASFISMAGLISFMGYDGSVYLMGWTGGYVLLAMLLAPYLRKFGKYTVPDFVGERYYSKLARTVAAVCAVFVSFTYVAGQMRGVGIVFSRYLNVSINTGVIIGMAIVAFFSVIGGMKGITWTQVAQYGVLILAYLIPAIALSMIITGIPIPQAAFSFSNLASRLEELQKTVGMQEYMTPFVGKTKLDVLCITIALMVGTAGLPHVIVRFYTVPDVRSARFSAGWALIFIALLYTTAPAIAMIAKYNLVSTLNGLDRTAMVRDSAGFMEVTGKPDLEWIGKWEKPGLLKFTADKNADGKITFAKGTAFTGGKPSADDIKAADPAGNPDSQNEVYIDNDIIVLSTPDVAHLPAPVIALVAAGGLAAALSTASGLLLVISSSVSHDLYFQFINPNADEKQRLLIGRIVILVAVIIAGLLGIYPPAFVAQVVAFAFGLAAASFFPIIILGIFNRRINNRGATAGMVVGLVFTIAYIVGNKFMGMPAWFLGISAEGIGTIGAILNFVVAFAVSYLTPPPPHIQELVASVRVPRGVGAAGSH